MQVDEEPEVDSRLEARVDLSFWQHVCKLKRLRIGLQRVQAQDSEVPHLFCILQTDWSKARRLFPMVARA